MKTHIKQLPFPLLLCLFTFIYGCGEEKQVQKVIAKTPQDINRLSSEQLQQLLANNTKDSTLILSGDTLLAYPFFKENYTAEAHTLFTDKGKWTTLGDSLIRIIKEARFYGLIPDDYHYLQIDSLYTNVYNKKEENYDATAIARIDLLMNDAYYKMGAHLNKGRVYPDSLLMEWKPAKLDSNWSDVLKWGINNKQIRKALDSLEPKHEGYQFLKTELKKYILENEHTDWDSLSFTSINDTTIFLADLKKRLLASGDYDTTGTDSDSIKMANAIKSFQTKMNLDPDGKLGKLTKQAIKQSKEQTIRQIEMAMERWRWEPKNFSGKYFWVNIPSADLHIYEFNDGKIDKRWKKSVKATERIMKTVGRDTLVLYSKIVVGKPETPTPTLTSRVNYMLIYPYWNVPYSIAWKEILPAVQRDTTYLRKKNFEVIGANGKVLDPKTIQWKRYNKSNLPFKFRQRIGDDNSLGVVKFNFNNKYGVYLHDTNSKRYFKTFYRYQSHGCMRLEKYWETAKFLTREDTVKLPYDTLAVYFATPEQRQINMKKTVPIYVRYYTAVADSAGLHRYIDIYRKDEKLAKYLYKNK